YSSAFYALKDTRTPLRFAIIRVALTTALGYFCSKPLPPMLGLDPKWGVAGLTASAGVSGWIEYLLLKQALSRRIGQAGAGIAYVIRLWAAALAGAAAAWAIKLSLPPLHPILMACATLVPFGLVYLLLADPKHIRERIASVAGTRR